MADCEHPTSANAVQCFQSRQVSHSFFIDDSDHDADRVWWVTAVKHMAGSLAVEWAKEGIRVNCLSPGYMLTPLTKKLLEEDVKLKVCR